jgi:hypothetical protein
LLFADRFGTTLSFGYALTLQEGTTDYEFQYKHYLKAVGICPNIVFIDADPGATAAVRNIFPYCLLQWCLWHIFKNINKKVRLSGARKEAFMKAFRLAQKQISKNEFARLYAKLKVDFPEAVAYLDDQLTNNSELWAECHLQTFTAGCQSTQRGEGANRYIKKHCRRNSPLRKIVLETMEHMKMEKATLAEKTAKEPLNMREAVGTAKQLLPADVYRALNQHLTTYGMSMATKQIASSAMYLVTQCCLTGEVPTAPTGNYCAGQCI